ncbi:MAG TPA: hypothetical protein VFB66_24110 [Tepidisphaeraceae bacterium]|nr:hypothetical protein [Tepidisphaeraceae bacterium]
MDIDMGGLVVSFIFGSIGLGMFIYGRKMGRFVPLAAGLLLMVVPYFIPNWIVNCAVCSLLTAAPYFIRE